MEALKKIFFLLINNGTNKTKNVDINRKIVVVNIFAIVGVFITTAMGLTALIQNNFPLTLALFIACFAFILGAISQRFSNNYIFSSSIILYPLYFLMFYLVYSGGVENTGPLWIFMTAPVTFFISGLKNGLLNLSIFLIVTCCILFFPLNEVMIASYPLEFKLRLIYSFLTVTFLSAIYEYYRELSFIHMQEISQKFEKLAKIDSLTQLSNRHAATQIIEYEQRRLERNKSELSLILCDIDHFKLINDKYGHDAGDFILIELAKMFTLSIRKQDTIARWGGEEFLFILPDTCAEKSIIIVKKIHQSMNQKFFQYQENTLKVTVSMGIKTVLADENIKQSINTADEYLYQAKNAGRNRSVSKSGVILPEFESL